MTEKKPDPDDLIDLAQKLIDALHRNLDAVRKDTINKHTNSDLADIRRRLDILERQGRPHEQDISWGTFATHPAPVLLQ